VTQHVIVVGVLGQHIPRPPDGLDDPVDPMRPRPRHGMIENARHRL
jgi:hypothetical protein